MVPWPADYRAGIATDASLPAFPSDEALRHAFTDKPETWDNVDAVRAHLKASGFTSLEVRVADNTTMMEVAEVEAMLPFSLGMMIEKFWTNEEVEKFKFSAAQAILKFLEEKYGGGTIVWKWLAVIACGKKE